ncbi:hypothetical protein [Demequina lutea]|uniref:Uncharacterized protein n=1 Tax=Demequina lutea TaxID=431489 RepID=A0A7Z0CJG6_9MICO|nr:hypothetical protein [Demequina lutea]NYI40888.1 hypothetical protein [Demequina lutea]
MFTESGLSARKFLGGLVGGTIAGAALGIAAHLVHKPDFGKGAMIGAGAVLVLFILSAALGARRPAAARVMLGIKDERERAISVRAGADAALAMFGVGLIVTIAGLWNIPPLLPGGAVLIGGEAAFAVSLLIRLRRS